VLVYKKGIDRLLDAYQEGLLPLSELRNRIPKLRKRETVLRSELQTLETDILDQERCLQFVDNIEIFLSRMRESAESLSVLDRQKVLRIIVKEILVGPETLTIKHSIPTTRLSSAAPVSYTPAVRTEMPSYLLCRRSNKPIVSKYLSALRFGFMV